MGFLSSLKNRIRKFIKIAKSYFKPEKRNEVLTIVSTFTVMHILEYFMINYFVEQSREENTDPNHQYLAALGNILVGISIFSVRYFTIQHTNNSLEMAIRRDLTKRILSNKAIIGL